MAKLAREASRYTDMVETVKKLACMGIEMNEEERTLFSAAYKHLANKIRSSWSTISQIEQQFGTKKDKPLLRSQEFTLSPLKDKKKDTEKEGKISKCYGPNVSERNIAQLKQYRASFEEELTNVCNEVFSILDTYVVPANKCTEGRIFFLKMRAEHFGYLAEIAQGVSRNEVVSSALGFYTQATRLATVELHPTHPVRLALGLSFAIFYYQILHVPERATRLAKETFDAAVEEMEMETRRENSGMPMWTDDMLDDIRSGKADYHHH